ncbi:MAG: hypothetical protein PHU85_17240 [Phycisphaerae bacterium]|nr:hypothetical protein [Phycisphaerae bacterium]
MSRSLDSIFTIDRRIIFVFVFLIILGSLLVPFSLTIRPTKHVEAAYAAVKASTDKHGVVLMSWDFDPQSAPELEPAARAMLRHIFARKGRVLIVTAALSGIGLHQQILSECAQEFGAVEGVDYAYLGWKPVSTYMLIVNMGQNFASAYPTDMRGVPVTEMPVSKDVLTLKDIDYIVDFAANLGLPMTWINYANGMYDSRVGLVVTGVTAPDLYNFVASKQVEGMLGGLVGSAQYEQMVKDEGIYLLRRFSASDIVPQHAARFCRELIEKDRSPLATRIWAAMGKNSPQAASQPAATQPTTRLSPSQEAIKKTADAGFDQLEDTDKQALADALNAVIQSDAITPEQLAKLDLGSALRKVLDEKVPADKRTAVLRRLYIESQFPRELVKAQTDGQAVRWMTPQSLTHLALIAAMLVGNACYLWERARAKKAKAKTDKGVS